ncbi:MAG: AMP-dependent synthetase [Lautropia sp.]|nr:AMP-dependent synthetase [Lautropia sp.]MDL1908873.1 AMP-dependent synthetase [Betaproteobacteria bacterium PRO1]MEB2335460.1 AMP-binding protein [Burkholderiales bacterium]RIK87505.1 MAG: AMP-dependent synthetase [Burkholderiales bacterium]
MASTDAFLAARDLLFDARTDYERACREFAWPDMPEFNWALDYFDVQAASAPERLALWLVEEDGAEQRISYAQMSERSNRAASFLRALGVRRGERILVMLPNVAPLWEVTLAAIKLGAVLCPTTTLLSTADLADRLERGRIRCVVTDAEGTAKFEGLAQQCIRVVTGGGREGWTPYAQVDAAPAAFAADGATRRDDPLLLYFTSGTTARPKMVLHTQQTYPVGHLSTMYWIGLKPGGVHWNISSAGWAKHAWSCVFAPWNAGATVFVFNQARFDARRTLDALVRHKVTTLCAPPTVWRALILEDLKSWPVALEEALSAGEPLNPEVIERVRHAWGLTIRDGYGQTETTCIVANSPGQPVKAGSMGRPMPGYRVVLLDAEGREAETGEVALALQPRPLGLMAGYADDETRNREVLGGSHYRTSDVASRDEDGYLWYIGRADDVFKSSDYRISPFELESVLIEHEAVAEAAVVPSPDARRLAVPKAFVILRPGFAPGPDLARSILAFVAQRVAPYQKIRRIEFADLPKTISGKIRRVELRALEGTPAERSRRADEYREEDL